ncbi:MAG TPA: hypothetical protein VJ183_11500 [Chloroflexia bacterium]|nr:hypothetical protein [Chloroflexia bacterium]
MSRYNLAGGIFFRLTMQGAGYGALLGSIYGILSPVILLLLSVWIVTDFNRGLSVGCISAVFGFAVGGMIGMLSGFTLGIISALVVIMLTLTVPPSLPKSGLYRPIVRALCVATVGLGLLLTSIWFDDAHISVSTWLFWLGLPSLIAALAFWRIGGSVATWVERDSETVIAGQG